MCRMQKLKVNMMIGTIALTGVLSRVTNAADTVEPFDVGATDFEMYAGVDGLGLKRYEKTVSGNVVLGYGILPRLSGYLGATLEANEYFASGTLGVALGIYGNVVDLHHFDVDLFLDFAGATGAHAVTPAFELNFDADAEMRSVGLYLRGGIPIYGREISTPESETDVPKFELTTQLDATIGVYVTMGEIHQFLAEFDTVYRPAARDDERRFETGGAAFGYNVMLTDRLELINQAYLDIPQDNEPWAAGISSGFIATLP